VYWEMRILKGDVRTAMRAISSRSSAGVDGRPVVVVEMRCAEEKENARCGLKLVLSRCGLGAVLRGAEVVVVDGLSRYGRSLPFTAQPRYSLIPMRAPHPATALPGCERVPAANMSLIRLA
jgi:hypothetical protein